MALPRGEELGRRQWSRQAVECLPTKTVNGQIAGTQSRAAAMTSTLPRPAPGIACTKRCHLGEQVLQGQPGGDQPGQPGQTPDQILFLACPVAGAPPTTSSPEVTRPFTKLNRRRTHQLRTVMTGRSRIPAVTSGSALYFPQRFDTVGDKGLAACSARAGGEESLGPLTRHGPLGLGSSPAR